MGLTDDNGVNTTMLVSPTSAPYAQGGGFGNMFGGDGWWILILFLLLGNGGWGNGGFGGGAGMIYPWMNQANQVNDGFRDQMINGNVTEIRSGVNALQNQLCNCCGDVQMSLANGFAGVNSGVAQGFAAAEAAANARQIANMQTAFGAQTAVTQGMNDIESSLQNCCCENRAGIADLKYTVATENCADRTAAYQNTQAIIEAINTKAQGIQDKLCQLELDNYKGQLAQAQRDNVGLQNQLNMANLAASQVAQTADIRANQATTANQLISELRSCPIPAMPVYGQTPIFTCNQNQCGCNGGCGCGI